MSMAESRESTVIQSFIGLAELLVDDFDVLDLSTRLTEDCAEVLDVAAAGLLLADPAGMLHLLAATTEQARTLEAFQLQRDEGPCLDSFSTGLPVAVANLAAESARWPRFTSVAQEQGFASMQAVPLMLRGSRLGALGLFGATPGVLSDADLELARGLAHVASIAIAQQSQPHANVSLQHGLQTAIQSRAVLELAKGVLAELGGLEMQDAFSRLRMYAHRQSRLLTEVARDVVNGDPAVRADILSEPARRTDA